MTNSIFKQYIGTLEEFKAWLSTNTNKSSLGSSIVFIHANDIDDAEAEFTGWIYANGHYYQSGTSLKIGDIANMLVSGDGVRVRMMKDDNNEDKIYFDAVVQSDIKIAGGPLASTAVATVFTGGKIPKGMTIQKVLETLFLKEIWGAPSNPSYTFSTSVDAPTVNFNKSGSVKVGTIVTCSATAPTTTQATIQKAEVSNYTYGYSLNGTTIVNKNSYIQSKTPTLSGDTSLVATFTNLYDVQGTAIDNNDGLKTEAYVGEGQGTYQATYTGQEVTASPFTIESIYNVSNTSKISKDENVKTISQDGFIVSNAYSNGKLDAPTNSASKSVTGVWGYFYKTISSPTLPSMTSDDIRTWTWSATQPKTINIGAGVYGIAIACPSGSMTDVQQSNPVAPFYKIINSKSVVVDAENNFNVNHNYTIYYILNDGPTTASQTLTITYA